MNAKLWLDQLREAPRKKAIPVLSCPSVSLMGNVDPAGQFRNGTPSRSVRRPCVSWRSAAWGTPAS